MHLIDNIKVVAHCEMTTMMASEVLTALDSTRDYRSIPIHFDLPESEEVYPRRRVDNAPALDVSWCCLPKPFGCLLAATIMIWPGDPASAARHYGDTPSNAELGRAPAMFVFWETDGYHFPQNRIHARLKNCRYGSPPSP